MGSHPGPEGAGLMALPMSRRAALWEDAPPASSVKKKRIRYDRARLAARRRSDPVLLQFANALREMLGLEDLYVSKESKT